MGAIALIGLCGRACAAEATARDTNRPLVALKMTDGKTVRGIVRFEPGKISIEPTGGTWAAVDLEKVAELTLVPAASSDAANATPVRKERPNFAHGLKGEYFADKEFKDVKKALVMRYDGGVDFQWGLGSPDPAVPDDFSARWTGQVEPRYSEAYTFHTTCDDGLRLWVGGKQLIDRWQDTAPFFQKGTMELKAGQRYDVRMEYHDLMSMATARLEWESKSQKREVVPASRLYPPAGDAAPRIALVGLENHQELVSPESIALEAVVGEPPFSANRVEYYAGKTLIGMATARPFRVIWKGPTAGEYLVVARAANAAGVVTSTEPVAVRIFGNAAGKLPPGWVTSVIGDSKKGSVSGSDGAITLTSNGGNVWGDNDTFPFAFQRIDGDWHLVAHVGAVEQSKDKTVLAGGLMIRDTLSPSARFLMIGVSPRTGVVFLGRGDGGAVYSETPGKSPAWLKMEREGSKVRGMYSEDGKKWTSAGAETVGFLNTTFVGVALASGEGEGPGTMTLDQLSLSIGQAALQSAARGVMLTDGSVIAGQIGGMEGATIHVARDKEILLGQDKVARLLFRPVTEEVGAGIGARTGVLLVSGDFFEGEIREIANGRVKVTSVLFGAKTFDINAQVVAIVLRDVKEVAGAYEVRSADGSVIHAKSLEIQEAAVVAEEVETGAKVTVRAGDVRGIKRDQVK